MKRICFFSIMLAICTIIVLIFVCFGKIDYKDNYGYTIENMQIYKLNEAIDNNDIKTINEISSAIDINQYPLKDVSYYYAEYYNVTPLGEACIRENLEAVQILLKQNANVNLKTIPYDETPLMLALLHQGYNKAEIVKLLFEHGADKVIKKKNNEIQLSTSMVLNDSYDESLAKENLQVLHILKDNGISLSGDWVSRISALALTSIFNDVEIAQYILDNANVDFNINQIVDERDYKTYFNGATCLILAVKHNSYELTKLLLSKNADKSIKDNLGKTALDYAKSNGKDNIVNLLK